MQNTVSSSYISVIVSIILCFFFILYKRDTFVKIRESYLIEKLQLKTINKYKLEKIWISLVPHGKSDVRSFKIAGLAFAFKNMNLKFYVLWSGSVDDVLDGVYYLNAVDDVKRMDICKDGCVYLKEKLFNVLRQTFPINDSHSKGTFSYLTSLGTIK